MAAIAEAEHTVGIPYLEGWVERTMTDGRRAAVRAFGARAVHIIAGNSPLIAALTVIRNAITRSDAVIKTPSNDPLTALAIVRTMVDIAPDHPLTRHVSVAYWKGGDTAFEERLSEFRTSLPRNQQLLLDALVLTACSARGDVQGSGAVSSVFDRLRAYWLDASQFDPQQELMRETGEERALLDHVRRLAYSDL